MAIDTSKIYIDFEVLRTNTCKALKILDLSNWASAELDMAYITVLTPGSTIPVILSFQKGKLNILNTNNLNLTDVKDYSNLTALPDGIYTITVSQCENDPFAATKYFLQDCTLRCQIVRKLISVDILCDPCRKELLKDLMDILLFMDAAQAHTESCNINKAMECYQRAALLLSRISDSTTGACNC